MRVPLTVHEHTAGPMGKQCYEYDTYDTAKIAQGAALDKKGWEEHGVVVNTCSASRLESLWYV